MKYLIDYTREIFSLCQINKFKLWFIIFIGLISSALDYISLVIIGPIGNLLLNKNGNSFSVDNIYLQNIIDKMQIFYNGDIIITLSIIVLLIFLIKTYLVIFIYHLLVNIKLEISAILKVKLMKIYQNLDYKSFIKRDTSDYIQIMQQSVTRYSNALFSYLKMITEIIIIFAILLFLVLNKGAVTFLVFLFFAFFILIYQLIVGKKLINWGRLSNISFRKQIQSIQEGIEGLKELRINGKKKIFFDRLKINSYQLIKYSNFADTFSFAPRYLIEFLTLILLVGFYIFFYYSLKIDTGDFLSTVILFGFASLRLIPSFSAVTRLFSILLNQRDATRRVYHDINFSKTSNEEAIYEKKKDKIKFEKLIFDNVTFSYEQSSKNVIENISFSIDRGKSLAIIGRSGAGKTTMIDLLLGLIKPNSGKILLNQNVDIHSNLFDWQNKIYYLPQDKFLFNDTILKNITLDTEIDPALREGKERSKKLENVIKQSRMDEYLYKLPTGLDTIIGERGMRLSGGQRQRLVLARALFHNREILVFDEITSSLDVKMENEINQLINNLKGKKTVILITHNENLIQFCDYVYKLENSKIIKVK